MPNYQQGKIYSIRSLSRPDLIYIGSTIQPLSKRMGHHRTVKSCSSREITNIGDAYIELLENYPCNDIYALKSRENYHMRNSICVNKNLAIDDCPHGIQSSQCKKCDGSSICEHKNHRNICKECQGAGICEHNHIRSTCKECHGSSICEHNKMRCQCKECNGTRICEHNRFKPSCKDCGGSSICEHNHIRSICKECNPYECDFCEKTFAGKHSYQRHIKSLTHKKNYMAEFLRVFESEITLEEVPEF